MIRQFQKIRLKNGREAIVVEILEPGTSFLVDVEIGDEEFNTDEIDISEIQSVFEEIETPIIAA